MTGQAGAGVAAPAAVLRHDPGAAAADRQDPAADGLHFLQQFTG